MQNNTNQSTGLPNNVPCKPLVAIMGWAMTQAHLGIHNLQEYHTTVIEGFLESELADDYNMRQDAIIYMSTMRMLFKAIGALKEEEIRDLNTFFLEICKKHSQPKFFRNTRTVISLEGEEIDSGSLWKYTDQDVLVLEDEDTFASSPITNAFAEIKLK